MPARPAQADRPLQAAAAIPASYPVAPSAPSAPAVSAAAGLAESERPASAPARPQHASETHADSPTRPVVQDLSVSGPTVGQELVRAAMQWVAADVQLLRGAAGIDPRSHAMSHDNAAFAPSTASFHERRTGEDSGSSLDQAAPPSAVPHLNAGEPMPVLVLPARSPRVAAAVPPAPFARDEVVEVSIGSIHVRVDAPAAQTVARSAATSPAAARRAATETSQRGGLSRRALRRI